MTEPEPELETMQPEKKSISHENILYLCIYLICVQRDGNTLPFETGDIRIEGGLNLPPRYLAKCADWVSFARSVGRNVFNHSIANLIDIHAKSMRELLTRISFNQRPWQRVESPSSPYEISPPAHVLFWQPTTIRCPIPSFKFYSNAFTELPVSKINYRNIFNDFS